MPKTLADERLALVALTQPPADPNAITVAEFDAGTRLECRILKTNYRLSPTGSETINEPELCSGVNASVPGASNYEGTVTPFRYLTEEGLADAANDVAWDLLKEKGATLYLIEREGPQYDAAGAAGQEYSYFEVVTDDPQRDAGSAGFIKRTVPLHVQRSALNKKLVAAAGG